jgi:hypothetical protein
MGTNQKEEGNGVRPEPKYVPLVQDIPHGSTEVVGVVRGKPAKLIPGGEDEQLVEIARVVLTPDSSPVVVSGGVNQSVTVYEGGKINPEVGKGVRNARKRALEERKRKDKAMKRKIKKGAST